MRYPSCRNVDRLAARRLYFFAAREAVGVLVVKGSAEEPGIEGEPGVQVRLTPVHIARKGALGVR